MYRFSIEAFTMLLKSDSTVSDLYSPHMQLVT